LNAIVAGAAVIGDASVIEASWSPYFGAMTIAAVGCCRHVANIFSGGRRAVMA
jgi:hypothetical protein